MLQSSFFANFSTDATRINTQLFLDDIPVALEAPAEAPIEAPIEAPEIIANGQILGDIQRREIDLDEEFERLNREPRTLPEGKTLDDLYEELYDRLCEAHQTPVVPPVVPPVAPPNTELLIQGSTVDEFYEALHNWLSNS